MRKIDFIVVHCTATQPQASVQSIKTHWKTLGWNSPGYHFIVKADGTVDTLLDTATPSNGVAGYNSRCVNVAYIGGILPNGSPADTRTAAQKTALQRLLKQLATQFQTAQILGHKDFAGVKKACPCFSAKTEYQNIKTT